jgi:tRNA threonylcarbamoyladenosine biosynthesis protein TsaB
MLVLGIDTATRIASVGLVADGTVLAEASHTDGANHTETLLPLIASVLDRVHCSLSQVDGFGVSIGPGSFTGLRIALGAVKGFAYALGQRVAAVPTLEALARTVADWDGVICPVLDARKGEIYTALFQRSRDGQLRRLQPDQVTLPEPFFSRLAMPCLFLGDGVERYRDVLQRCCGPNTHLLPFTEHHPRGGMIAHMAWERLSQGESDDLGALTPTYVRQPDAEFKRKG